MIFICIIVVIIIIIIIILNTLCSHPFCFFQISDSETHHFLYTVVWKYIMI
jgi:hypothetical protein